MYCANVAQNEDDSPAEEEPKADEQPQNGTEEYVIVHDDANEKDEKKDDAEWEQVNYSDIDQITANPEDMELANETECKLMAPIKMKELITNCPPRTHAYKWRLYYSTDRDGLSTNTLYSNMESVDESILIIQDSDNRVFGAFIDCQWIKPTVKKIEYRGTQKMFVFQCKNALTKGSELIVYRASGDKPYCFRNDAKSVIVGAGECPAIYFNQNDFILGRSVECDTFKSPCLSKQTQFKISQVQIWAPVPAIE